MLTCSRAKQALSSARATAALSARVHQVAGAVCGIGGDVVSAHNDENEARGAPWGVFAGLSAVSPGAPPRERRGRRARRRFAPGKLERVAGRSSRLSKAKLCAGRSSPARAAVVAVGVDVEVVEVGVRSAKRARTCPASGVSANAVSPKRVSQLARVCQPWPSSNAHTDKLPQRPQQLRSLVRDDA